MPNELLRKLALYSILPLILAFTAIFLNGLFQPQLQWDVKLLESQGGTYRIENLGPNTTTLLNLPAIESYSKEGYRCGGAVNWVYVQNKLFQDKLILEKWVNANNTFTFWITFVAILHAVANATYLLKQKMGWGGMFVVVLLVTVAVIALVTVLGPLKGGQFACWAQVKVEAELTKISFDGMVYVFMGVMANILAIIVMIKRWNMLKSVSEQADGNVS